MKLMVKHIIINLPPCCNTKIWETNDKKFIKICNIIDNKKYIFIFKKKFNFIFDKWGNSIIFEKKNLQNNKLSVKNKINSFLKSINIYYFKKIKFKGKGFRIKFLKKNKIIKFYFGKSHITFVFLKKIYKKRINKYKFLLKSLNSDKLNNISKIITDIKIFNFYTLRGIRLSRQIIYKRKGKKGTYI